MASSWWSTSVLLLSLGVVLLSSRTVETTFNGGVNRFTINTLLTCFIGEGVPEERLRLPLSPARPGRVWLPVDTAFRRPLGIPDQGALLEFLGSDFNDALTSLRMPLGGAVLARNVLPVIGSGGEEEIFRPDMIEPDLGDFATDPEASAAILSWINRQFLGNCMIMANWTRLPDTFFPPYLSASYCVDRGTCSFPAGLTCYPDIGPGRIVFVPMLRWDCCWSFEDGKWNWRCGWRKVDAPIIVDCSCACEPQYRTTFD